MIRSLSSFQRSKHANRLQQIYSLEVSIASENFFKVREESMLANRYAWVLLLLIGQGFGHASLVSNSHQNPFKIDCALQSRMVLVSCWYVVSFASF